MNWLLAGILAYLAIQLLVGLAVSRRIRNETDYILAGRSLGLGVASFSIFATWFGAESIQGAAGAIYADGLSGSSADPFGYVTCILLVGLLFARPLWRRGFTTFGDLFRERYSPAVERLVILLIVPSSVIWSAAQVRAFGNVVSHASTLPLEWSIGAAALFVVFYTSVGGLLADAWTDLVQGLAIIAGLLLLMGILLTSGDLQTAWAQVPSERLRLLGDGSVPWYELLEAWTVPIVGSMLAVELLSRVLGCRSAETARSACLVGGGLYLSVGLMPAVLGLCGPYLVPGLADAEQLVPALASRHLGTLLYVPFAGALISAILSTVDSCLLAGSTLVTHNVVLRIWPDLTETVKLRVSRLGVLVMGLFSFWLAFRSESIKDLVEFASAFGSAGVFVVACFGLFTSVGGPFSAVAGLCTGFLVWLAGIALGWPAPYVTALVASCAVYLSTAMFSRGTALTTTDVPGAATASTA
jgi:SSS family solute:Na+ symporter